MTLRRDRLTDRRSDAPHAPLPGSVSCTYLAGILHFAVSSGADRALLMRAAQLTEADMADPDRRFPLDAARQLFTAAAQALQQPAFALHFGVGVPCTTLTLAAALAAAQPTPTAPAPAEGRTLRDALVGLNRYAPLGVDFGPLSPPQRFRFVETPEGVWLEDRRPDHADGCAWPALTESVFARFATGIRRRGGEQIVRALTVTHAAPIDPAHRDAYAAVFRVPITFAAARNALCLDPAFLEQPLEPLPRPVEQVLTKHAETQLHALAASGTWQHRVEQLLRRRPSAELQQVCRELALSRHTLHRRLRAEGTTYEAVLRRVRRQMADLLLREERLPVGTVSARLGYSEPAAFSRAYKRWTGAAPSARISGK